MRDRGATAPAALAFFAETAPEREFIRDITGEVRSFGEFHQNALRWATVLRSFGLGDGDHVITMMPNSPTALEIWIALSWLRARDVGAYAELGPGSLKYMFEQVEPSAVVTIKEYLPKLANLGPKARSLRILVVDGAADDNGEQQSTHFIGGLLGESTPLAGCAPPSDHDVACVLYTSGTTGRSKGVVVPWGQYVGSRPVWADLTSDDVYYSHGLMHHTSARGPLTHVAFQGGRLLLRPSFKTQEFWRDVREYGCTITHLVSAELVWLLGEMPAASDRDHTLRSIMSSPVNSNTVEFRRRFGVQVRTAYGQTEAQTIIYRGPDLDDTTASAGKTTPGYEVRVVDENDHEVPTGKTGEVVVRSQLPWRLNAGYLGLPEATARAWRNGWFHTGDAGRFDQTGRFFFVDRLKDCIRRRGENISAFELELAIKGHPGVLECAAIGVPADIEGEEEVKIYVVARPGRVLDPRDLVSFLADRVAAFMIPRYVEFADALPTTPVTRRVQKDVLRSMGITAATWDRNGKDTAAQP
jgi:crotonobetaine/carnitine-CoA ligase